MYDLINNLISHSWITQGANEQQYVYYITGALIIILTSVLVDMIYRLIRSFWRKGV